jgi:hypothetical protein
MLRNRRWTHALLLTLILILGACGENNAPAAEANYKIGERLPAKPKPQTKEAATPAAPVTPGSFRNIEWDELIPKDWDPAAAFKDFNLATLKDSDPRAMDLLATMRAAWDNAPTAPELNGVAIRIPGFIVPIERSGDSVRELLLVPYFGACVHVPPPPANQIIHVLVDPPLKGVQSMATMWVSGTLETIRSPSSMGTSGYRMKAAKIVPYTAPQQR